MGIIEWRENMRRLQILGVILVIFLAACQPAAPAVNTSDAEPAAPESPTLTVEEPTAQVPITAEETATEPAPAETQPAAEPVQESPAFVAPEGDASERVIEALLNVSRQRSFRVDQEISLFDENITSQIEMILPDRYRMVSQDMELMIIGGDTYIRIDEDAWMSYPYYDQEMIGIYQFIPNEENVEEYLEIFSNARETGSEVLDGERMRVYQYTLTDPDDAVAEVTLWVSEADGLPRRQELVTTNPDPEDNARIINIYKDYNEPFEILAP
jgi:hypothetical protein